MTPEELSETVRREIPHSARVSLAIISEHGGYPLDLLQECYLKRTGTERLESNFRLAEIAEGIRLGKIKPLKAEDA